MRQPAQCSGGGANSRSTEHWEHSPSEALAHQARGQALREIQPLQLHMLWHTQPAELYGVVWGERGGEGSSSGQEENKHPPRHACTTYILKVTHRRQHCTHLLHCQEQRRRQGARPRRNHHHAQDLQTEGNVGAS